MPVIHEIETARVSLRPLRAADGDALHELWTDAEVRRYLWDGEVVPAERTASIVATNDELFRTRGFGLWGVRREGGPLIGFAGYWFFHEPPELELLYGFAAPEWGQGLATEVARALVRYGFEEMHLQEVRACTDLPNAASARVMLKAGLRFEKQTDAGVWGTVFYHLWRADFHADGAPYAVRPVRD